MEQGTFHSCAREPCTHRSCKIRYAIIISYSSLLSIFGTLSTASHWPAITQYKRIDCLYSGGTLVVSNLEFIHSPSTRHNNFSIQKKKSKPSSTADNLIWHSLHHPCPMCCFFRYSPFPIYSEMSTPPVILICVFTALWGEPRGPLIILCVNSTPLFSLLTVPQSLNTDFDSCLSFIFCLAPTSKNKPQPACCDDQSLLSARKPHHTGSKQATRAPKVNVVAVVVVSPNASAGSSAEN